MEEETSQKVDEVNARINKLESMSKQISKNVLLLKQNLENNLSNMMGNELLNIMAKNRDTSL